MRLPRRLPWASQQELIELHSLIWDDFDNEVLRARGVARLSIYLSSPSCPLFIHLLHSLLTASLSCYPPRTSSESLTLRMTYAMAVVRFINGMADPLQTGPYARPISMIAQRLGIPIELVQLRHQATHEDLPSLPVLRAGLWTCIAYLRDNSLGPLIFASDPSIAYGTSTSRDAQRQDLSTTLSSLIKRYKRLMKAYFATRTSKAASSTGSAWSGGAELRKVMREMEEMWNVDEEDAGLVREVLVDALVQTGCLVPLARKKRPSSKSSTGKIPMPPLAQIRLWKPLLQLAASRLYSSSTEDAMDDDEERTTLAQDLSLRIVAILQSPEPTQVSDTAATSTKPSINNSADLDADFLALDAEGAGESPTDGNVNSTEAYKEAKSYRYTLMTWLTYLWLGEESESAELLLEETDKVVVGKALAKALLTVEYAAEADAAVSSLRVLADKLAREDEEFAVAVKGLPIDALTRGGPTIENADEDFLQAMEARLQDLSDVLRSKDGDDEDVDMDADETAGAHQSKTIVSSKAGQTAVGWTLVDPARWKPCPIGTWLS